MQRITNVSIESIADRTKISGVFSLLSDFNLKFNPSFEVMIRSLHYVLTEFLVSKYSYPETENTTIPEFVFKLDSDLTIDQPVPSLKFSISTSDLSEDWVLKVVNSEDNRKEVAEHLSNSLDKWVKKIYDVDYERGELQKVKEGISKSVCALVPLTMKIKDTENFGIQITKAQTREVACYIATERKAYADIFGAKLLKFRANAAIIGLDADRYFTF